MMYSSDDLGKKIIVVECEIGGSEISVPVETDSECTT